MSISVNNNAAALIALQNLNATSDQLTATQAKVSTGLKVGSAKDNASTFAIAQKQRAEISALGAVSDSLNRANSIADVASSAGQTVSDLLNTLKQKVVAAADPSIDTTSRAALNSEYKSILKEIAQAVSSASYDGANILDGSLTNGIKFLANADANSFITLSTQNFSLGGAIITLTNTSSINTATNANTVLTTLATSISNVNLALANIGAQQNQLSSHATFVKKLSDSLTTGVSNLVDADLAAESAKLQALQVKQQLGTQALSIANQSPQSILSLFK